MKKSFFILALSTFMTSYVFTSCKSNVEKEADAVENVQDAKEDLNEVQNEIIADTLAQTDNSEWDAFKTQAQASITANEVRISDLKKEMNKVGTKLDANYKKSVDVLEQKNIALKAKIDGYKSSNQANWDSFKREFDSDMSTLGNAFKDLTVDNKK